MKKSLTTAKLFDVTALAKHLLDCDHYLFRSEKANLSSFGYSQAKFTLFYSEDIKIHHIILPPFQKSLLPIHQ